MTTKKEKLGVPSEWSGSAPEYLVYNSVVNTFNKRERRFGKISEQL